MARAHFAFLTLIGALTLALIPNAIGLDDDFFREQATASAPILRLDLPLPPDTPSPLASLLGVDRAPTGSLPPAPAAPEASGNDIPSALSAAIKAYAEHDLAAGDRAARLIEPGLFRVSAEWAALRLMPRESGLARIEAFLKQNPAWPTADWLKRRSEEALYGDPHGAELARAFFDARPPQSPAGKIALARLRKEDGDAAGASVLIAEVWRKHDVNRDIEKAVVSEFGGLLTKADHKYRADRLLYKERIGDALRAAELAGPDVVLLARARAAVINEAASDAAFTAVPKPLQVDPGLLFAKIQKLRRADKPAEAAQWMLKAPRDPALVVDGDEWWVERRLLAREMLDQGDGELAYQLCRGHAAQSGEARIEAEFHAGWIALRFLDDPQRALGHFTRIGEIAKNPASQARGFYWQGRAFEAQGQVLEAESAYARAAMHSAAFYGQLARLKLGAAELPLRLAPTPGAGQPAALPLQVADALFRAGGKEIAASLAYEAAQRLDAPADLAALAALARRMRDASLTLNLGKAATQHGAALDDLAFPDFGVPDFQPLAGSVDRAMVYAIVRQESAFAPRAASGAGAKGLMQLLVGTARVTASRAKVSFDAARLTSDPAFNAQLGAAHLGVLFEEHGGSSVLAFAAYNAGGSRVKQWVLAHGDPRDPAVDPIDWIELIPITETRNYVQRILENLQVYRVRFGGAAELRLAEDLKSPRAPDGGGRLGWRQAAR